MIRNHLHRSRCSSQRVALVLQLILITSACNGPAPPSPGPDLGNTGPATRSLRLSVDGLWAEVRALEVQAYLQPVTASDRGSAGQLVPLHELGFGLYSLTLPRDGEGVLSVIITGVDRTQCRVGSGRREVFVDQASSSEVVIALIRSPVRSCPLTVLRAGDGGGKVVSDPPGIDCGGQCSGYFNEGSLVVLAATPEALSLLSWAGPCESIKGAACSVRMQGKTEVNLVFVANLLSINKLGAGMGQVVSDPPGIDCGAHCQLRLPPGAKLKLTALPANLSVFAGWGGACSGTGAVCELTLDGAVAVTAAFSACTADFCPFASGTDKALYRFWGSAVDEVWAVGDQGTILHGNGTSWTAKPSGTMQLLWSTWGSTVNDVWAVGGQGTIGHWDGTRWTAQASGTPEPLYGVWGSAGNDVWAVGSKGTILNENYEPPIRTHTDPRMAMSCQLPRSLG